MITYIETLDKLTCFITIARLVGILWRHEHIVVYARRGVGAGDPFIERVVATGTHARRREPSALQRADLAALTDPVCCHT
ncbi:hypothetical protein EVAR_49525_1 [Eumeta japonica]|uniref:Uncharacterized protein n=1 Tax=Eumeta variegata TaxID=151549 RepID=A0A4C1XKE7_EUMVA|nr:hypothetical protein EVAR_49525_1 [Eumeta japonica]